MITLTADNDRSWGWLASVLLLAIIALQTYATMPDQAADSSALVSALLEQDVAAGQILGLDEEGVPMVCGYSSEMESIDHLYEPSASTALPVQTRGWETIPNVIRTDGVESFRVEVDVNGPVNGVTIDGLSSFLILPSSSPISLQDDGLGEDRVAGDTIYTAGPFYFDTTRTLPSHYNFDSSSPQGIFITDVGRVNVEETDFVINQFLLKPEIGFLRSDIAAVATYVLSPDIVASPHLINIRTTSRETQGFMRLLGGQISNLTVPIYSVLPDRFDMFLFFSTNKIERLPRTTRQNFYAGIHSSVQRDYTGTGGSLFDGTASYGSSGKLLGVNVLDAFSRGIKANNATHEIVHQWSSFTSTSLGLSDGTGHYLPRCSAASLVGGFAWLDNGDGTFTLDCDQGRNGGNYAPPLDKYMMGLIDADDVPTHYAYQSSISSKCISGDPVLPGEIVTTVAIADIQATHGVRSPGPGSARRAFNIAFIAESHDRLFNATEMTFYDILAEHYTKDIPPADPDPYLGFNWPPMTRYFGESTRWCSRVLPWSDLNLDLQVTFEDFALLSLSWLGAEPAADFLPYPGGDGVVDIQELTQMGDHWLSHCP